MATDTNEIEIITQTRSIIFWYYIQTLYRMVNITRTKGN